MKKEKEGGKSEKPALIEAFAEMMIEADDVFAGNHDLYYLKWQKYVFLMIIGKPHDNFAGTMPTH